MFLEVLSSTCVTIGSPCHRSQPERGQPVADFSLPQVVSLVSSLGLI